MQSRLIRHPTRARASHAVENAQASRCGHTGRLMTAKKGSWSDIMSFWECWAPFYT
jgi:hypothetical protein